MTFDKLVYRESAWPDLGRVLTVDFGGIGELMLSSGSCVNWRRITQPVLDLLRAKLDACDFESWRDDDFAPAGDGSAWGLELFEGEKAVKRINGGGVVPEQWPVFQSVLELCGALAENRRQSVH